VIPVEESFNRWRTIDRCGAPTTAPVIDKDNRDGTEVVVHSAEHCASDTEVKLFEVRGGGHTWPGGTPYLTERLVGKVSSEIDAAAEIWAFVSRFSRGSVRASSVSDNER
jgi:poly(3-hydroxybutyrate) depolymerase